MLDDVRNLLGDVATGKIKDERIALLADQLNSTDRKLVEATHEISALEAKIVKLEAVIEHLESKAQDAAVVPDQPDPKTAEVLKMLFKMPEGLDAGAIMSHFGMEPSVVMFHLDSLKGLDFIGHKRGRQPIMGVSSDYGMVHAKKESARYFIKPKGRAYIMKNG